MKRAFALLLTLCFILSTGCAREYMLSDISKKEFLDYWNRADGVYIDDSGREIVVIDRDNYYIYARFNDNEHALEFFEDYYYDSLIDAYEDKDFEGSFTKDLHKGWVTITRDASENSVSSSTQQLYTGVVLLHGEFDDSICIGEQQFYVEDDFYGGVYLFNNIVVVAYTTSANDRKIEEIDDFLESFDYPSPNDRNRGVIR